MAGKNPGTNPGTNPSSAVGLERQPTGAALGPWAGALRLALEPSSAPQCLRAATTRCGSIASLFDGVRWAPWSQRDRRRPQVRDQRIDRSTGSPSPALARRSTGSQSRDPHTDRRALADLGQVHRSTGNPVSWQLRRVATALLARSRRRGSGGPECPPRSRVIAPATSGRGALGEVGYLVAACAAGTVEEAAVGVHPLGVAEQVEQDVGRPVAARAPER